jgi:hypothetical protein
VAADDGVAFVEDGAGGEQALGGAEDLLDQAALAIAQRDLEPAGGRVGAQDVDPVAPGGRRDALGSDGVAPAALGLQVAAIAAVADESEITLAELGLEDTSKNRLGRRPGG